MALIDGVSVKLGARDFVIPPLNFKLLQTLAEPLAVVNKGGSFVSDPETRAAFVAVITACVQRNYPEVTNDDMLDLLDVSNAQAAMLALLGVSGYEAKPNGKGAAQVGESAGTASTTT
ncbi:hypothetical protein DPV79_16145 [Burkholderia reimsis]|uniref:Phage tail assembly protein n=1 Tax=Burkholderia reimsis TaxID=2234132 RepID=A0A365QWP1_9BURK|nr:hypothetical protein [Burkholderia reimsis]RBB38909.1 hypothetical protein DPV79_16145 [Burkholderia reimsis]